ncbi:hypothetical protein [uncultured Anaerococcus sp.]|uniref:hypothetical protein n=1 Tax=uncultured Anaerococcus sp. TaxID=293428 RepID=UPI00288C0D2D|nr:hypothetical protein [uncultured Anaerococcus sp.]
MSRKLVRIFNDFSQTFSYDETLALKTQLKTTKDFPENELREIKFLIPADEKLDRLRLLVILSPILIATFDSSSDELSFFRKQIDKSSFPYGLYPNFFTFNEEKYRDFYKNNPILEDIYLGEDKFITFTINPLKDDYILALDFLLEKLILEKENSSKLLAYFQEIRDDIVINGRRSILANGIQAFYLSKYVLVRDLILFEGLMERYEEEVSYLRPIYDRINTLKRANE